jgi:molybdenum cofactor biosynthesis enzyme MoaA
MYQQTESYMPDKGLRGKDNSAAKYLRVVLTPKCPLACGFCHKEGDPAKASALDPLFVGSVLRCAHKNGIKKIKFLGGEPMLYKQLPELIQDVRTDLAKADLSVITAGSLSPLRLSRCFDAGLDRANLSIHGWTQEAFNRRTQRGFGAWSTMQANIEFLLEKGRELKLNYVYRGSKDIHDIIGLLTWAANKPVTVAVLDDLGSLVDDAVSIEAMLVSVLGKTTYEWRQEDPYSLPTRRIAWGNGLVVELKDHQLGKVAPWKACGSCEKREDCREGIQALRLSHAGELRLCMDRKDAKVDLLSAWLADGDLGLSKAWGDFFSLYVHTKEPSKSGREME